MTRSKFSEENTLSISFLSKMFKRKEFFGGLENIVAFAPNFSHKYFAPKSAPKQSKSGF